MQDIFNAKNPQRKWQYNLWRFKRTKKILKRNLGVLTISFISQGQAKMSK